MHALRPREYKCTSHVCGVCVQVPASSMFFLGTALLHILSCSFPVSILDKRDGVYACDNNKFFIIELEKAIRTCRGASSEVHYGVPTKSFEVVRTC